MLKILCPLVRLQGKGSHLGSWSPSDTESAGALTLDLSPSKAIEINLLFIRHSVSSWGFSDSSVGEESACNAEDPSSVLGSGRSPGKGIGYSLQYSWASLWPRWLRIHLQCRRRGFNPWVGKIPWLRKRVPTPVFWTQEFHGLYGPWGCKESDTTEWLPFSQSLVFYYSILNVLKWWDSCFWLE